jgi:hypothetical protein
MSNDRTGKLRTNYDSIGRQYNFSGPGYHFWDPDTTNRDRDTIGAY